MSEDWGDWAAELSPISRQRQERLVGVEPTTEPTWNVVTIDYEADNPNVVRRFASFDDLRQFLIDVPLATTWAVAFYGWLMPYTQSIPGSNLKYIRLPDGTHAPLFNMPENMVIAEDYFIGDGPNRIVDVRTPMDADDDGPDESLGED